MSWLLSDHYKMDNDGNFATKAEYERAKENGDIRENEKGQGVDDTTGQKYDSKGDKW